MERTDEWNGKGAMYDYGFRIYDPRIAKFLSVDPLTTSYPWYTPYQFAGNKPTAFIDLDGLEEAKNEIHEEKPVLARGPLPYDIVPKTSPHTVIPPEAPSVGVGTVALEAVSWVGRTVLLPVILLLAPHPAGYGSTPPLIIHDPQFEPFAEEKPYPDDLTDPLPLLDPKTPPPADKDGNDQYYLYLTKRDVKKSAGYVNVALPYVGITKNAPIGGRYSPSSVQGNVDNMQVIAVGSYDAIKGAEQLIITLNSEIGPNSSTRIDNVINSTSDPARLMLGTMLLDSQQPNWESRFHFKENESNQGNLQNVKPSTLE